MNYIKNFQKIVLFCILILLIFKSSNKKNVNKINTREKNNNINITKSNDIQNAPKIRKIKDVLFINGYKDKKISHPFRYRILHQIEQLNSGFLENDVIDYVNFEFSIVTNYRIIIFFRCPLTQNVEKAIKFARSLNKKVLFDIDDLIFDIKYTNLIPYIKNLSPDKKIQYDDYVNSIGKTLKLCDQAITTTDALAIELKNYVSNIFINHNVASDEMWKLSEKALMKKVNRTNSDNIIIGYFSVSLYHNSDIEIIKKALIKILKEFKNAKLFLIGEFEINEFLAEFSSQIINKTYIDWKELIEIISNFDINIIPLEYNIFNEVKSENRWVEAALVKVPTIASNIGEFTKVINQNETGILCNNSNDWYISLKTLINNEEIRKYIGENAYNFCKKNYNSIYVGSRFANYINSIANKHIGFFIPCLLNSGGMYVILKHACILTDKGWDVDLIIPNSNINLYEFQHYKFNIISLNNTLISSQYDVIVATLYTTIYTTLSYYKTKKHVYLVQNYETDFNSYGNYFRTIAEKTYSIPFNVEYITISKWCQNWLFEKYKKKSKYAPNGIDVSEFKSHKRDLKNKKIRILIEGNSNSHYKNVDESFKIVETFDKNKYEIWYLSNDGKPKDWYKVDKFFSEIPHEKVIEIYEQCDILLKSSWLESFSYPPLEMMATGGYCIVVPNEGNKEYLENEENCLFYKLGDINDAINCINRLISDNKLQDKLYVNGLKTAKKRDWNNFKEQIIALYE